jgi:hypothetical protein
MKLVCPECRRENEPERIYCHDCGTRLDRSALAKEKSKEEDPKETRRRLRSILDPRRAKLRHQFFQGSKLLLGSFLMAAVVQMVRPPDLPPATTASDLPPQINLDLENLLMDPRTGPLRYTEEQVNEYLAYTLKGKRPALSKYLQFQRAAVALDENGCRLTLERSLFGYSLFTATRFSAQLTNGNITIQNHGGRIGRLPVHPALMQYSGFLFSDFVAALDRERRLVVKLGAVEFGPKTIILYPRQQP